MKIYVEPTDPEKMLSIGKILDEKGFLWGNTRTSIFGTSDLYERIFCKKPFDDRLCVEVLPNKRGIYMSWFGFPRSTNTISDEQFLQNLQNELFILNGGDTE